MIYIKFIIFIRFDHSVNLTFGLYFTYRENLCETSNQSFYPDFTGVKLVACQQWGWSTFLTRSKHWLDVIILDVLLRRRGMDDMSLFEKWKADDVEKRDHIYLHDHIHKPGLSFFLTGQTSKAPQTNAFSPRNLELTIDSINIFLKNRAVPFPLHLRQPHVDVDLLLC